MKEEGSSWCRLMFAAAHTLRARCHRESSRSARVLVLRSSFLRSWFFVRRSEIGDRTELRTRRHTRPAKQIVAPRGIPSATWERGDKGRSANWNGNFVRFVPLGSLLRGEGQAAFAQPPPWSGSLRHDDKPGRSRHHGLPLIKRAEFPRAQFQGDGDVKGVERPAQVCRVGVLECWSGGVVEVLEFGARG